ncbi:hypothetical protein IFR05_011598 [Cadophora sp. M221]|nr:hypothetical protein IFR05_011598 [Cadophora sp. M221]
MKHIIVLFGPSGCGKFTVREHLQEKRSVTRHIMKYRVLQYHSRENVEKMKSGSSLNGLDRAMWLCDLSSAATAATSNHEVVGVFCSALKRNYRKLFRSTVAEYNKRIQKQHEDVKIRLHFRFLQMSEEMAEMLVEQRQQRMGHYMPKSLVRSQFEILEIP